MCSASDARIEELCGKKDGEAKIRSDFIQAEKVGVWCCVYVVVCFFYFLFVKDDHNCNYNFKLYYRFVLYFIMINVYILF